MSDGDLCQKCDGAILGPHIRIVGLKDGRYHQDCYFSMMVDGHREELPPRVDAEAVECEAGAVRCDVAPEADPRCLHCGRPVLADFAEFVEGVEGRYHYRCTQPPAEVEHVLGTVRKREANVARGES